MLCLVMVGLGGCGGARSGSFLVTVKDRVSGQPVEGAIVEVAASRGVSTSPTSDVRTATDGRGEGVLLMPAWERIDLTVRFDGGTEVYSVAGSRIPAWDAPANERETPDGGVRFIKRASDDTIVGQPALLVTLVRIRYGI
ncbi:MAG: hypothetical protein SGJ11_15665 [Phycisphaerae bacterium]|nr:hypothetical protein [Phycisphaerae bacterium]